MPDVNHEHRVTTGTLPVGWVVSLLERVVSTETDVLRNESAGELTDLWRRGAKSCSRATSSSAARGTRDVAKGRKAVASSDHEAERAGSHLARRASSCGERRAPSRPPPLLPPARTKGRGAASAPITSVVRVRRVKDRSTAARSPSASGPIGARGEARTPCPSPRVGSRPLDPVSRRLFRARRLEHPSASSVLSPSRRPHPRLSSRRRTHRA